MGYGVGEMQERKRWEREGLCPAGEVAYKVVDHPKRTVKCVYYWEKK